MENGLIYGYPTSSIFIPSFLQQPLIKSSDTCHPHLVLLSIFICNVELGLLHTITGAAEWSMAAVDFIFSPVYPQEEEERLANDNL